MADSVVEQLTDKQERADVIATVDAEPTDLLEDIVSRAAALVGTEHGYVYLKDPHTGILVVRVGIGIFKKLVGHQMMPGEGLAGKVFQSGTPLAVDDYHSWVGRSKAFDNRGRVQAVVAVPLTARGETVGVIALAQTQKGRRFGVAEVDALSRFAELASITLHNARIHALARTELLERRLAEERLRAILAGIADGVTVQDPHGRLIYANDTAARLTGFSSAEALLEASTSEVIRKFEITDEHGNPFPPERLPGRLALQGVESAETVLGFQILATAEVRWAAVRATPVSDGDGRIQFAVNVFRDITDQRRADVAQKFLADAGELLSSSLEYETTLRSVARLAVPRIADWCGIDILDEEGQVHRLAVEHIDPRRLELARELQARFPTDPDSPHGVSGVLRSGRPEFYPEISDALLEAAARDAAHFRIIQQVGMRSAMIVPLLARGRTLGAITLVAAESGRRFSEQDLSLAEELARRAALAIDNARLYRESRRALELRNQFLSIASHELKTPVTLLKGYAQLLQSQAKKMGAQSLLRPLEVVGRQVDRMISLIDDLLAVSRIESGRVELNLAPFDLGAMVDEVVSEILAGAPDITIRVERLAGDLRVMGDRARVQQVVTNLLMNAVKYSRDRREVGVRARHEGDQVLVDVTDYGIGIPREQQPHIFELYFRASNAPTKNYSGLGLGLYISKTIVERHGGAIWVESAEGKGSTFHFSLPALPPQQSD